jgi:hypothetical protein
MAATSAESTVGKKVYSTSTCVLPPKTLVHRTAINNFATLISCTTDVFISLFFLNRI